jgi:2-polyprenyl-6-methoxyphenol hydroxylase-like FAD-dependent oxidoreductase
VLALWLTRLGVRVRIIDRTAEPGTTSRAVAVQARTLEFCRQVDLASAVVADGVKVAAANLWVGGARAARLPLGRLGAGRVRGEHRELTIDDVGERAIRDLKLTIPKVN